MSDPTKIPASIEWMRRVVECAADVYVREQSGGRWATTSLAECSPEQQAEHVKRWIAEGRAAP